MAEKQKTKLVCLDRDGTINVDNNYYLGSSPDWRSHVEFLPGVVDGIRLLNERGLDLFILTNQAGVALDDAQFSDLTVRRMHEVNAYIIEQLAKQKAFVNGYFACPYVDSDYVRKAAEKGRRVNPNFVLDNCDDLKPRIGMINKSVSSIRRKLEECDIYMIGDRSSDVEMGLNAGGMGILVASPKTIELGDVPKVERLRSEGRRVYIAKDFLDAAGRVLRD